MIVFMAKCKPGQILLPPPPQRAVISRLSFLYQAATYLTLSQPAKPAVGTDTSTSTSSPESPTINSSTTPLSRYYLSHLIASAEKSQQRLSPSIKRTICKRCTSILITGVSCTTRIENASKQGRKRKADVIIVECNGCGVTKRYPTDEAGRKKQKQRKKDRTEKRGKLDMDDNIEDANKEVAMSGT